MGQLIGDSVRTEERHSTSSAAEHWDNLKKSRSSKWKRQSLLSVQEWLQEYQNSIDEDDIAPIASTSKNVFPTLPKANEPKAFSKRSRPSSFPQINNDDSNGSNSRLRDLCLPRSPNTRWSFHLAKPDVPRLARCCAFRSCASRRWIELANKLEKVEAEATRQHVAFLAGIDEDGTEEGDGEDGISLVLSFPLPPDESLDGSRRGSLLNATGHKHTEWPLTPPTSPPRNSEEWAPSPVIMSEGNSTDFAWIQVESEELAKRRMEQLVQALELA